MALSFDDNAFLKSSGVSETRNPNPPLSLCLNALPCNPQMSHYRCPNHPEPHESEDLLSIFTFFFISRRISLPRKAEFMAVCAMKVKPHMCRCTRTSKRVENPISAWRIFLPTCLGPCVVILGVELNTYLILAFAFPFRRAPATSKKWFHC